MTYAKLTLKELKSICKDNYLKNYSALNKTELIAFIKKNKKNKQNKNKQNKKKVGGFNGALNRDTLKELLQNISEEQLKQKIILNLDNLNITTIKPGTFDELTNLRFLHLSNNQITTIEYGVFNGLTDLDELLLINNKITTIEPGVFNGLTKFKSLDLAYNYITTIEHGVFNGLTKLQSFNGGYNYITTIEPETFNELTDLRYLYLNNNKITTIEPGVFNGLTKLKTLDLKENRITTIEHGVFNGLTSLERLKLSYNQITTIEPGVFNRLTSLERTLGIDINLLNVTSRNYYNRFIETNTNTNIIMRNNDRTILITKNMLNTCKNNKLYNHILKIDNNTLKNIRFNFEGQTGINYGGLTRTVYDIFYNSYIKKFFEINDHNGSFILKNITTNNKENFISATNKLIILAKKGQIKILIPIHETLMEILNSENVTNTINLRNKEKYNDKNTLTNKTRKNGFENQNSKISDVIAINNGNKNFNMNWKNIKNNDTKKEIFLRRYLNSMGFEKYTQFEYMYMWFKTYWDNDIFITKLSFTKEDFFKRIKIIKIQDGNKPRQEYELSSNNNSSNLINKFLNSNNGKQLIEEYPNLKVILDYINQEDDKYRKKFNKYITGSIYNNGKIQLLLINGNNTSKPIFGHTCFISLDIYKINPNQRLKNHTTLTNNKFKTYVNEKTISN